MPAHFITFSTYGHYLPGQDGYVDRRKNIFGSPMSAEQGFLRRHTEHRIDQPTFLLGERDRAVVLAAIIDACQYKNWHLHAAHVRTNHVHVVVGGDCKPEPMMNVFKSYASRRLNERGPENQRRKRWARHGSTRYLWTQASIDDAVGYAVDRQGATMAVFIGDPLPYGRGSVD